LKSLLVLKQNIKFTRNKNTFKNSFIWKKKKIWEKKKCNLFFIIIIMLVHCIPFAPNMD
jgi:hypothetical protein